MVNGAHPVRTRFGEVQNYLRIEPSVQRRQNKSVNLFANAHHPRRQDLRTRKPKPPPPTESQPMTYRDEQIALDERKAALHRDLEQAKTKLTAQRDLAERTARMERELVEIEARLRGEKRRLPMLEKITVASPCHAQWDQMIGDDRVRYCGSCEKNVFNLSAMTRDEAESLIIASGSKICVRMYRRTDGTVMTEDCTVGATKKRRKRLAAALVGAAALGAAASMATRLTTSSARALPAVRVAPPTQMLTTVTNPTPSVTPPVQNDQHNAIEQGRMEMGEPTMDMGDISPRQGAPPTAPARPSRDRNRVR